MEQLFPKTLDMSRVKVNFNLKILNVERIFIQDAATGIYFRSAFKNG